MANDDQNGKLEATTEAAEQLAESVDFAIEHHSSRFIERFGITNQIANLADGITLALCAGYGYFLYSITPILDGIVIICALLALYTTFRRTIRWVS